MAELVKNLCSCLPLIISPICTPDQGLVVRLAVPMSPPVSLSCSQPKNMGPVYKTVARPMAAMKILPPLPVVPLCTYEQIRERNITKCNAMFFRQRGEHLDSNSSYLILAMAAGQLTSW